MKCPRCENENPEGTRFCGRCGRELPATGDTVASGTATFQTPSRGLERGTTFARRFEIIEEIGKGGMGMVYKAYDSKIREVVALKLLKPEIASDIEIVERFRNEIKLARQVSHRHVCRMYDIGEEWLSIYISMEYVAGEDLKSFIRRSGHLNEAKAVGLARQIVEGLAEAHRLGVVHRDLKPQNIMIDKDGNAKIMDFGIARSLHTRGVTGTGVIIGTPEYMAPEQADGRDVDSRADIYALGTVLFEMVTGRVPFEGETPLSIVLKHRSEPPADPQTLNTQISTGLSRVILKCLEKPRERRYQSAAEVLADLEAVEKGLPVTRPMTIRTKPATQREITVKFKLRKILLPALAVGALVIVGLVSLFDGGRDAGPARAVVARKTVHRSARTDEPGSRRSDEGPRGAGAARDGSGGLPSLVRRGKTSAIMGYLAPFMNPTKFMSDKDAQELEKALAASQGKVSRRGRGHLPVPRQHPDQDQRREEAAGGRQPRGLPEELRPGRIGDAQAPGPGQRAGTGRKGLPRSSRTRRGRSRPRRRGDRPNLLTWIALEKEKDASDAFAKNDFSGARILCGLLDRVHLLSLKAADEDEGLAALRDLTASIRAEADAAQAPPKQAWLYERAKAEEDGARREGPGRPRPPGRRAVRPGRLPLREGQGSRARERRGRAGLTVPTMKKKKKRLLFVCYGNICRSPMAEGIARKRLGPSAEVASAGIGATGGPASEEAVLVMKLVYGVDISSHVARPVGAFDLGAFDCRHRHGRLHLQPPPGHLGGPRSRPLRLGHRRPAGLGLRHVQGDGPQDRGPSGAVPGRGRPRRLSRSPALLVHHRPEEAERRHVLEDDPQRRQDGHGQDESRDPPQPGPEEEREEDEERGQLDLLGP